MKEVNEKNFKELVLDSKKPVVLDLFAEWCGPCKMVSPILEELSQEYADNIEVIKCDVDENPGIAQKFNVRGIPTILFFKDGQLVDKKVGMDNKQSFEKIIKTLL